MATAYGPASFCGNPPLDGPVLALFAGAAWVLPLTWWQTAPVYATDGVTVVTPGVPVNMTGMTLSAEFLTYGSTRATGVALAVTSFVPLSGSFTVTVPGAGQSGDLTSNLPIGAASLAGPRIRVGYTDAAGNPEVFGTFYVQVR